MIADVFKERDDAKRLLTLARQHVGERDGRLADPVIRDRIAACVEVSDQNPASF